MTEPVGPTRRRPRRRHPATGSRIAATALGATTMFGLVGIMGYAEQASTSPAPPPPQAADQPQLLVVQGDGSASATAAENRPTVRPTRTPATTPAGSTGGSH